MIIVKIIMMIMIILILIMILIIVIRILMIVIMTRMHGRPAQGFGDRTPRLRAARGGILVGGPRL